MDISAYGERNLARNQEDNDEKYVVEPCRVGEREKVLKSVKKSGLNKSNQNFKKLYSRNSIDRNNSFD